MKRMTTTDFIKKAEEIHGNRYNYSKVDYVNAHTNVTIICSKHGEFDQEPSNHLRGAGCKICRKIDDRRMPLSEFIRKANDIHDNKYDYTDVVYVNNRTPVKIRCREHGIFKQTPYKHLSGQACPKCRKNYQDTTESFIEKARKVHGDRYDYSKVKYVNEHTKVLIIDPDGGRFWQQPNAHLNGEGNPARRIARIRQTIRQRYGDSKYEAEMNSLLCDMFGKENVFRDYWSKEYPHAVDFYIKTFDLYIELNIYPAHGGHWFDPLNPADVERLRMWQEKANAGLSRYKSFIRVWTIQDVEKHMSAVRGCLNYLVFWNMKEFREWYNAFDFSNPVLNNIC